MAKKLGYPTLRLSNQPFVTHGWPLTHTDAKGHLQQMAYNRAGQLSGSWLTLKGGAKQVIGLLLYLKKK
ncbi:hypothetical protein [Yersinia pekkanenii]|uniref:Insecticidal toxin n=1 Tax=Yersinia pekkanenii TaxID=1288385 RepID=A0A0T9PL45_9GAMM|nr:hypothetical protein [Yersinia pekkanenii]CNH71006.1 insecticidal toxin [Yersinia pekkanenii]CRY69065.1 insecticidal toxin [Yersinia pekkanenii]